MVMLNWRERDPMTPERMIAAIKKVGSQIEEQGNVVSFRFEDVQVSLVFDTNADRMRLVSPIAKVADLQAGQMEAAMDANFHSTLDVRYCTSNQVVWAAFIHPLSDLTDELFNSAIQQVVTACMTFGGSYTSGQLRYDG